MKDGKNKSKIYRNKTVAKFQKKIDKLGLKDSFDAGCFLNIRIITSFLLFSLTLILIDYGYVIAPFITFLYYILLPKIFIDHRLKKKALKVEAEAITYFDVLKLALASGKDIVSSLEIASNNVSCELSDEVKYTLKEIKFGKSLEEALDDLRNRMASDVVSNIVLNIKESAVFGTNIIENLDSQISFLRDKKIMDIKEVINKIPIKISAVSVIFFIPILMLLILSPILIEYFMS